MSTPYCLVLISVGGDIDKYEQIPPCGEATDCLYNQLTLCIIAYMKKDAVGPAVSADDGRNMTTPRIRVDILLPSSQQGYKPFHFESITLRCVTKLDVTLRFAWILVPQALQLDSILPFSPSNTILK